MPIDGHLALAPGHLHDATITGETLNEIAAYVEQVAAPGLVCAENCGGASAVQAHEIHGAG